MTFQAFLLNLKMKFTDRKKITSIRHEDESNFFTLHIARHLTEKSFAYFVSKNENFRFVLVVAFLGPAKEKKLNL